MAAMSRYPKAQWAPWLHRNPDASGPPAYYRGQNRPAAVVLHVMQGHLGTARDWARSGYHNASWHFSVGRDGSVHQHLEFGDGGYHAGITDAQAAAHPPLWRLWRGRGVNVNHYTIGVEHEGFAGQPFTGAQAAASRDLCRWLAAELGIPLDRDHFPPHAAIDTVNRVNDFNTPALREAHYRYMLEEDDAMGLTAEERRELDELKSFVAAINRSVNAANDVAHSAFDRIEGHTRAHGAATPGALPDHLHEPGRIRTMPPADSGS